MAQRLGRLRQRLGLRVDRPPFLPGEGDFIGWRRLRDWLRLLSFEVETGRFGGFGLPRNRERWMRRNGWLDRAGERWWPMFGALYFLVAVKRVRGMRLVGLVRDQRVVPNATPAPATAARRREEFEPVMERTRR